jgi:hypothetical protein
MQADFKSLKLAARPRDQRPDETTPHGDKPKPRHENDDGLEWPLLPFPPDWYFSS